MKKFQVIFRTRDCGITAKRIYVSAKDVTAALQTAKTELSNRGYIGGFVIYAVNPL